MSNLCAPRGEASHTPDRAGSRVDDAELARLRPAMLRYAHLLVRDHAQAEDLVQETLEVVLLKRATFAGASTLKTWVFSILRHRVVDHQRAASRSVNLSSLAGGDSAASEVLDDLFDSQGAWREEWRPAAWPTPDAALQSRQFLADFDHCLHSLPEQTRRVFTMREVLGLDAADICTQLGLSTSNYHVILHRARMKLRMCLDAGWGRAAVSPATGRTATALHAQTQG